jgi:hypothetical protein
MVSLNRKLIGAVFAGLSLGVVLFLAGAMALAAVPTLPAILPTACAGIGFTCAVGAVLSEDLKETVASETAKAKIT